MPDREVAERTELTEAVVASRRQVLKIAVFVKRIPSRWTPEIDALPRHGIGSRHRRQVALLAYDGADGKLLRLVEEGTAPRRRLRHTCGGSGGTRRVHRGLLQQSTSSLIAGLHLPRGVRTDRAL